MSYPARDPRSGIDGQAIVIVTEAIACESVVCGNEAMA